MTYNGLDVVRNTRFNLLRGKRVGLVTHPAALTGDLVPALEVVQAATEFQLVALFGPEHGITGEAQDLIPVAGGSGGELRVHSLYGESFASLNPTPAMLAGLDVLVIDLVDIGSRYYTFQATMLYCLEACAELGLPVVVLDRPNPIGGVQVEGPTIQPGFDSFVGPHPIATRHGLTMGELAKLYQAERVPTVDLHVVACEGYDRRQPCGWHVPPSPNMPHLETATIYPGMCLIEGTNLSEGRGTTRPFQYVGMPYPPRTIVRGRSLVQHLRGMNLPGVVFLPAEFRPTFQKHAGQTCAGVYIIPTGDCFRPVRTGLAVLCAFREHFGDAFRWRSETYEFVSHIPAIDLLFGSARERLAIDVGTPWQDIAATWEPEEEAFRQRREAYLLYRE